MAFFFFIFFYYIYTSFLEIYLGKYKAEGTSPPTLSERGAGTQNRMK